MNLELSKVNPLFRNALGLDVENRPGDWTSAPGRKLEAAFAAARALVVVSVLLGLSSEPFTGTSFLSAASLIAIYSLYAAGMLLAFVTMARQPSPLLLVAVHLADIFWACAFTASIHSLRPVLLLIVFPMLTSVLRWGPSATLATTLSIVGILEASSNHTRTTWDLSSYLHSFQTSSSVIFLGVFFAHIGQRQAQASSAASAPRVEQPLLSGTPPQIIQRTFEQAFALFNPKHIQLLVEESNSGRMFLWHSERSQESYAVVHSEEFDHSSADPYLRSMPGGDWVLHRDRAKAPVLTVEAGGKPKTVKESIPAIFSEYFNTYSTVVSVVIDMGDEWQGRFVICDPFVQQSNRVALETLRNFCQGVARQLHTAHLCLRACRDTAAEERARLARELHDGVIQSLLGVDLRLESLKRRGDALPETQSDMREVQDVLRREAMGLRQLVNDSRRRALRPERLLEYLSDLLERFQRDSGVVTRFFADLDNDPMPPRICHEIARLAEEAIVNAQKHSRGSTLTVRLGCVAGDWVLVVVDDGVGFDFRGIWTLDKLLSAGLGPRIIKDRVQSLNSDLMIESTPTGARIEITIPKNSNSCSQLHLRKQRTVTSEAISKEEIEAR